MAPLASSFPRPGTLPFPPVAGAVTVGGAGIVVFPLEEDLVVGAGSVVVLLFFCYDGVVSCVELNSVRFLYFLNCACACSGKAHCPAITITKSRINHMQRTTLPSLFITFLFFLFASYLSITHNIVIEVLFNPHPSNTNLKCLNTLEFDQIHNPLKLVIFFH
jgi:hypothetical protein